MKVINKDELHPENLIFILLINENGQIKEVSLFDRSILIESMMPQLYHIDPDHFLSVKLYMVTNLREKRNNGLKKN